MIKGFFGVEKLGILEFDYGRCFGFVGFLKVVFFVFGVGFEVVRMLRWFRVLVFCRERRILILFFRNLE